MKGEVMKLFWLETADHCNDWFIIAPQKQDAVQWFADAEGYAEYEVAASWVCDLPQGGDFATGWPHQRMFDVLNAHIEIEEGARVVRIAGKTYKEGIEDSIIGESPFVS